LARSRRSCWGAAGITNQARLVEAADNNRSKDPRPRLASGSEVARTKRALCAFFSASSRVWFTAALAAAVSPPQALPCRLTGAAKIAHGFMSVVRNPNWRQLAAGQINMPKVYGWQALASNLIAQPIDLAA